MKKVLLGLGMAALVLSAFGCSSSSDTKTTNTAASAAPAAEVLKSVEAMYQRHDADSKDVNANLHCVYVLGQNNGGTVALSKAEVKTKGQCNWNDLKGKLAPAGTLNAASAANIVAAAASSTTLPAKAQDKWNCTAVNVSTSKRQVGAQDCADGSGVGGNIGKTIAAALGL